MLRKSPASAGWAEIFKIGKLQNWVSFNFFSQLRFFSVFIINGSIIPSSSVKMGKFKDGNVELCRLIVIINKFLFKKISA